MELHYCIVLHQALKNFQDAEDTSPGFYCGNWLYLAKTCYQLSKKQEAKQWLTKLLERKTENKEDEEVGHVQLQWVVASVTFHTPPPPPPVCMLYLTICTPR